MEGGRYSTFGFELAGWHWEAAVVTEGEVGWASGRIRSRMPFRRDDRGLGDVVDEWVAASSVSVLWS